jgi:hypothetical protein
MRWRLIDNFQRRRYMAEGYIGTSAQVSAHLSRSLPTRPAFHLARISYARFGIPFDTLAQPSAAAALSPSLKLR